jgi:cysteine desulfurase family protein (TIGR01976 family)
MRDMHPDLRSEFPALDRDADGGRRIYLNSAGGTLTAATGVRAMERAALYATPQGGEVTTGERATTAIHDGARQAVADFLNAPSPDEVAFHLSTSHALFNLAFAFRDRLRKGDNLVVTRIDHASNVSPWESLWGEDAGLDVRECGLRPDGTLDLDHLQRLVDRKTRLVAVTFASNGLGTVVPVREVVRIARRYGRPEPSGGGARSWRGALVVVDAVHHTLHGPIDVRRLGCDFLSFSAYKLFGPILGVLWGRKRWMEALRPYRVEPNENRAPVKYEQGTLNAPGLAGLSGALEYLLRLGEKVEEAVRGTDGADALRDYLDRTYPEGDRRLFKWAICAIREYERTLTVELLAGFRDLAARGVRLYGIDDERRLDERDPTFLFEVRGLTQDQVKRRLWDLGGIEVPSGNFYSLVVYREYRRRSKRLVRASFAHYDTVSTVRHFLDTLGRIADGARGDGSPSGRHRSPG